MARYLITYLGGNRPDSPEEGQQHLAKYMAWLESLGDAAVSPMNPLKGTITVSADGSTAEGSAMGMSGYTILEADSVGEAIAVARECPFLELNGTLEVSEMVDMQGPE